ncbi:MAG: HAD family hydrolase [Planctomycetota bacterium]
MLYRTLLSATVVLTSSFAVKAVDPLPSWNEGATKKAIISFVTKVTDKSSEDFVPPRKRIATFDNDGTLWSEQPIYFQLAFAFARVKELASDHPEWQTTEPFASILKGDMKKALAGGESAIAAIIGATHAGMTTDEFDSIVRKWARTARHPKTGRLYTEMVYQPMLELLDYLRKSGFKTFIVSGGGIDFMRPWAGRVYGIPPWQVVGSIVKTKFEIRGETPVVVRLAEIGFIDDKEGKPVGIQQHIGERPIFAAGNSDGDFQMLQWTTAGEGPRFGMIVHHTDEQREWAYDRTSPIGKLVRGLDEGRKLGWTIVDMKGDWKRVYPMINDDE